MQALGDAERQAYMKGKRILEVNPRHPLIQQVKAKFESDPENASTAALAKILYETALLESGFQVCCMCPCTATLCHEKEKIVHAARCCIKTSFAVCPGLPWSGPSGIFSRATISCIDFAYWHVPLMSQRRCAPTMLPGAITQ